MILFSVIKDYVTKKNIVIFSGINNYTYNGNSRYLFEYLSKLKIIIESSADILWLLQRDREKL